MLKNKITFAHCRYLAHGGGDCWLITSVAICFSVTKIRILTFEKNLNVGCTKPVHNSGVISCVCNYAPAVEADFFVKEELKATKAFCLQHDIEF